MDPVLQKIDHLARGVAQIGDPSAEHVLYQTAASIVRQLRHLREAAEQEAEKPSQRYEILRSFAGHAVADCLRKLTGIGQQNTHDSSVLYDKGVFTPQKYAQLTEDIARYYLLSGVNLDGALRGTNFSTVGKLKGFLAETHEKILDAK